MECYDNDFEDFLLKDTTEYYSVKAQSWIVEDSCPDYMIKVPLIRPLRLPAYYLCMYFLLYVMDLRLFSLGRGVPEKREGTSRSLLAY